MYSYQNQHNARLTNHVALDCEMVGTGLMGRTSMLARVSIVNQNGEVLLDKFCKPYKVVTDYRTAKSGIRPHNLINGEKFEVIQREVAAILQNRILVGHSVHYDLDVLGLTHPPRMIRDTATYEPLIEQVVGIGGRTPSLKMLACYVLGKRIQCGEHSSVEDARAVMLIFNRYQYSWEKY